ncbi:serine hydrolase domain-containing protein [Neolewinella persica]|uniref:serine hydrolase domain-containing protein n=1 Tax=Neolewinella persica TaxID=70998 RepID=UPI00035FA9A7|nr:serine hydrolase domain-containing protein [Neolewinella persica]
MKYISFFIICLAVISCSNDPSNSNLESQLDELFANEFSQEEPGGSVLVKKGDKIVFMKSYGLANLETKEKITENTIFNTGSISKTFVSNGILILNERDSLSLDDKLSKYFDDFNNTELASKVTIKHMLSHTSGLPDMREVEDNYDFYLTAKDKENFEPLKHADSLNFEPGTKFQYSNPSYNGLALIIEQIANEPWQQFIEDNIFKPSGMNDSKITNGSYPESGVAHGYSNFYKEGDSTYYGAYYEYDYGEVPTFAAAGNGGVWSSILDLAKYEAAIQKNVFLSQEMIKESRTAFHPENWSHTLNPFVGYSWFTGEQKLFKSQSNFEVDFVYHNGSQGGFKAFYVTIPEKDILVVGLFNRPLSDFRKLLLDSITLLEKNNWLEKY